MDPGSIEDLSDQALDALRRGDHVRALALADQLVAALPDHPVVHAIRAQALLGAGTSDEAVAEARRAVALDPENQYAHRVLGLAAWRDQRLTLAQDALQRAVALSGGRPAVLAEYAWFMASQRGPRLAEQAAHRAIETDADSSTAWAALGLAQYRLRRRKEAEESLGRALRIDPNDIYAQSAMAVLLQDQSQDGKAQALASLLEDSPGTEELVESIRTEAKRRQIARMLVERQASPSNVPSQSPWLRVLWLIAAAVMMATMYLLLRPDRPIEVILCLILPFGIMCYLLWRFLD